MSTKQRTHRKLPTPSCRPAGKWDVVLVAIERGWGATLRLCLIVLALAVLAVLIGAAMPSWR